MVDEIQVEAAQAPATPAEVTVETTPSTPAPRRTRQKAARASASPVKGKATKPAAKAAASKTPAKAARTPIPAGMTRSRGALIPVASGKCGFTGAEGQCRNPGRWNVTEAGQKVLSCTNHKNATKRTIFAPVAKARRTRKVATAAA
jgi:hypothetical protein